MTSFNHTNSTRERFRQHQANKDAERAAMAERERSEEHTSELQSRLHLVCRLLLEKKKQSHDVPAARAVRRGMLRRRGLRPCGACLRRTASHHASRLVYRVPPSQIELPPSASLSVA